MGCLRLTYKNFETPLNIVYKKEGFEQNIVQVWLSVDPLSDMYPSMAAYMYTAGNPVMLVDPDGRKIWITGDDGTAFVADETVTIERNQDGGNINTFRIQEDDNGTISTFHIPQIEKSGVLLELGYIHKQYHDSAEKIIELKQKKPKEAAVLYAKLKDDSHYIVEQILKF